MSFHVAMYLMCGPGDLFFQCGPEMPKGWTPLGSCPKILSVVSLCALSTTEMSAEYLKHLFFKNIFSSSPFFCSLSTSVEFTESNDDNITTVNFYWVLAACWALFCLSLAQVWTCFYGKGMAIQDIPYISNSLENELQFLVGILFALPPLDGGEKGSLHLEKNVNLVEQKNWKALCQGLLVATYIIWSQNQNQTKPKHPKIRQEKLNKTINTPKKRRKLFSPRKRSGRLRSYTRIKDTLQIICKAG